MTDNAENTLNQNDLSKIDAAIEQIGMRVETALDRLETATGMLHSVIDKLIEAETPGFWSEFTDEEAELAGAFDEDAVTEDAAYEASFDNPEV
jgi:hypothetical protein